MAEPDADRTPSASTRRPAAARSVLAIDPDAAAIERASARAARLGLDRVRFAAVTAQELDVGHERFDLAVLAWAL